MTHDELFYDRAVRRIRRAMLLVAVAGAAVSLWKVGWAGGIGFLLGAAVSVLSFQWFKELSDALAGFRRPRGRLIVFLGLRYLLFGAAGYVIVKFFGVNLPAILAGLLVSAAAVVGEILYELIYAR